MNTERFAAQTPLRLPNRRDPGDQVAGGRLPPGERGTAGVPDQPTSATTADEIARTRRRATGLLRVGAGLTLRESHYRTSGTSAIDRHRQRADTAARMRALGFCQNANPPLYRVATLLMSTDPGA